MKIAGNSVFPAGLRIESAAYSIEQMDEQAPFWGVETKQLEAGRYEGRISALHSGSVQLARSVRSLGSIIRGHVPRGTLVFCLPLFAPRPIFYRGDLLADSKTPKPLQRLRDAMALHPSFLENSIFSRFAISQALEFVPLRARKMAPPTTREHLFNQNHAAGSARC
jgi:hypothetical protein